MKIGFGGGRLVRERMTDMRAFQESVDDDDDDGPPMDDVCPICFGDYTNPCKANCGHWFCGYRNVDWKFYPATASCILQWWDYRSSLQQCKCPFCSCRISKLTVKTSLLDQRQEEVGKVIEGVDMYNHLCAGGLQSLLLKLLVWLLSVTKRILPQLLDPECWRFNYNLTGYIAFLLGILYKMRNSDFIPTGGIGIRQLFELCTVGAAVMLFIINLCCRVIQRRHVRHLAAMQPRHLRNLN